MLCNALEFVSETGRSAVKKASWLAMDIKEAVTQPKGDVSIDGIGDALVEANSYLKRIYNGQYAAEAPLATKASEKP